MRTKVFLPVVLLSLFLTITLTAFAQRGGGPPPNVNTGPRPMDTITRPESIQDAGAYGYWTHMTDTGRAGAVLLGKVALEGEVLPWEPILVTVSCNDSTVYTTQTDSKGNFGVFPNRIQGEISQLGDAQRQMQVHYEGCVLQGFLTGFRSTKATISVRHLRDDPNVGTITLSRDSKSRATAVSSTTQTAPASAARYWNKAGEYMLADKPDRARQELEKAVKEYPGFADAWFQLGNLQMLSSPRDARTCFEKAIAADPNFVVPYEPLAALAIQQEDWQGAVDNTLHSLQLDPDGTMRIWYYSALANFQIGRLRAAQVSAEKLLALDPLHNIRNGEQLLAAILARQANYAGALEHLRNCLKYTPAGSDADLLKQQIAQLEHKVSASN
jgi:hypothetical protein